MIDLNQTRERMLGEINASPKALANPMNDPADSGFVQRDEAYLIVRGEMPDDLVPAIDTAFSKRYAYISPKRLYHDFLYPIKKGIGNAYKWGNHGDPAKQITVEIMATNSGAFAAISDEGDGFDVESVVGRLQCRAHYFTHGGAGFRQFQKTKSLISYANGGRTLLIRFLCVAEPGKAVTAAESAAFGMAEDEEFMKSLLAAALPYFRKNKATLESCHVYTPDEQKEEDRLEIKYALGYRTGKSQEIKTAILTGRVLPERDAQADFSVAEQLYQLPFGKGKKCICIPKPVMLLEQLQMVLSKFNPLMDLRDYLKKIFDFKEVTKIIRMVAVSLCTLHGSMISSEVSETIEDALERHRAVGRKVVKKLSQASSQQGERVQQLLSQITKHAATLHSYEPVPIHGAFAWKSILYDDKRFYLYHFDQCRYSHPGFDVGGFLADLLRFYVLGKKNRNRDYYQAGREVFLETYFADAAPPWQADIPFFVASAMLQRLDRLLKRPEKEWETLVAAFLEECEQVLQ